MRIKMRLSVRMLVLILGVASIIFFVSANIIGTHLKKVAYRESIAFDQGLVKKYAFDFGKEFNHNFNRMSNLAQIITVKDTMDYASQEALHIETIKLMLENNDAFLSLQEMRQEHLITTELLMFDRMMGRTFVKTKAGIQHEQEFSEVDVFSLAEGVNRVLSTKLPSVSYPFTYSPSGKKSEETLVCRIGVPIIENDGSVGVLVALIDVSELVEIIDWVNYNDASNTMVVDGQGVLLAHRNPKKLGSSVFDIDSTITTQFSLQEKIISGTESSILLRDANEADSVNFAIASFKISTTDKYWAIVRENHFQSANVQLGTLKASMYKLIRIGLFVLALVVLWLAYVFSRPLVKTRKTIETLAEGDVHSTQKSEVKSSDELGEMANSVNTVIDGIIEVANFAQNIGKGNLDYEFNLLSKQDSFGRSIIEMRNSLQAAKKDEEARMEEERQLNWASNGINLFNRILQIDNENLQHLSYEILKTVIVYLEAHMGGVYLKNDEDEKHMDLISHIGFNKEKYSLDFVREGEGLVGRCMLEKESIFINDVPDDFDRVQSGLGRSKPVSILVVPLMHNRQLVGVLELESLKQIQAYQISFVEKISETIAATLAMVKTNERTTQLLARAQRQAEELEQQEEEMRQNMEEMEATQEEAAKREQELVELIQGFKEIMMVAEYDLNERLIDINDKFLALLKITKAQALGKKHKADSFMDDAEVQKQKEFWSKLREGEVQSTVEYIRAGKEDFWVEEMFIPVKDNYGSVNSVLCVGVDITDQQKTDSKIKQLREGVISASDAQRNRADAPKVDLDKELKVIDLTYLKMLYKKDPYKIYNILKLYFDTLPNQVSELKEVSDARDFSGLKTRISGLKTKMSYMGLKKIYEQCRVMEKMLSEEKNLSELPEMLDKLNVMWGEAAHELQELIRQS